MPLSSACVKRTLPQARQGRILEANPAYEKHHAGLTPPMNPPTPHTKGHPRTQETHCGINPSNEPANPAHKGPSPHTKGQPRVRRPPPRGSTAPRPVPSSDLSGPILGPSIFIPADMTKAPDQMFHLVRGFFLVAGARFELTTSGL